MKKYLAFIVAAALLLVTAACGSTTSQPTPQSETETNSTSGSDTQQADGNAAETGDSDLLQEIQSRGVLKVGIEGTFPPFTYHDEQDNVVGFDVEVAQAVGQKLGVSVEFTETKWDSLIAGLDVGHYDVVFNNVAVTPERQQKYDFTSPYSYSHSTLIVRDDYDEIQSFSDLDGKKSAQSVSSNYAAEAESHGAELVGTDGFAQSIELVLTGRADVTVNDDVTYHDYMNQHPDAPLKIIEERGETTTIAAILRQDNPEFRDAVNAALEELEAEGTLTEISIKYFGADISQK